jgi:folate-binding protein YgfZ
MVHPPATTDYQALTRDAAVFDFSNRGRLCLVGADRHAFINGQVTNNVKDLRVGQGCYAALVNAKGKMTCDLSIFVLENEILLDFEPGLVEKVKERLEKYIIAEDVQVMDASSSYGLLTVQGPHALKLAEKMFWRAPEQQYEVAKLDDEVYVANNPRLGAPGVDVFFPIVNATIRPPTAPMEVFEIARIEQGIPRFGADMDENTLAPEALDQRAISYSKGCYIGQEVIARIRTYGQVAKALRGLRFDPNATVPKQGDKIVNDGKDVGWITSAVFSLKLQRPIALGYVRKECNQFGARLTVNSSEAEIVPTPFQA